MIKRGLILCILTFLCSSLMIECIFYGDLIIMEFRNTENIDKFVVHEYDRDTFNENDTDAEYVIYYYDDRPTLPVLFVRTFDHTDNDDEEQVEVVTRNGIPYTLLSETKRKRQRTAVERAIDTGTEWRMIYAVVITLILLLLIGLPSIRMIPEEIRKRKKFFVINTVINALITVSVCICLIICFNVCNGLDGLNYLAAAVLLYLAGLLELLISWTVNSVVLRKSKSTVQKGEQP